MVHVEITSMCNARCPMCSRYTLDGFIQPDLEESHLSDELFYKFFTADFVAQLDHVYFSGVYGDPCMHPNLLEFCKYLMDAGVKVKVDSNAGYRKPVFWKTLAELGVAVNFAVDGLKDTNHIYRRNVKWEIVESNMRAFSQADGKAQWNFIVFEHNQHEIDEARQFAKDLNFEFRVKVTQKFKRFSSWNVMHDGEKQYEINPPSIVEYRHPNVGNRVYTIQPVVADNFEKFDSAKIKCKSLERNELFLNHQGHVLPCCYLGTVHGAYSEQLRQLDLDNFSLQHHTLPEIVDNMNAISNSWSKTTDQGKLVMCSFTCGTTDQTTKLYVI